MTDSKKILTAVAIGAAADLITGLLVAPDKGTVTRQRIADTARKVKDNVNDFTKSGISTMNNLKEKVFHKNGTVAVEDVV